MVHKEKEGPRHTFLDPSVLAAGDSKMAEACIGWNRWVNSLFRELSDLDEMSLKVQRATLKRLD